MSSTSTQQQDRVVIAVDPHKASWTAAAVGAGLTPLATLRVPVSQQGYRQLRRFANRWPDAVWAIEGAIGLGAHWRPACQQTASTPSMYPRSWPLEYAPSQPGTAARATATTQFQSESRR